VGDPSDNIPGVFGIGPKTARRILGQFYNLENLYQKIKDPAYAGAPACAEASAGRSLGKQKLFQKLLNSEEQARFSKKLILLRSDIELKVSLEDLICQDLNDILTEYFKQLGFQSLISRISFQKSPAALF
jgi:DNA polymerase-1